MRAPGRYAGHGTQELFRRSGAAAGAVELTATILGFDQGMVAGTINYSTPDPQCPINVIREMRSLQRSKVLALSQSTAGQAAAVIVSREA